MCNTYNFFAICNLHYQKTMIYFFTDIDLS